MAGPTAARMASHALISLPPLPAAATSARLSSRWANASCSPATRLARNAWSKPLLMTAGESRMIRRRRDSLADQSVRACRHDSTRNRSSSVLGLDQSGKGRVWLRPPVPIIATRLSPGSAPVAAPRADPRSQVRARVGSGGAKTLTTTATTGTPAGTRYWMAWLMPWSTVSSVEKAMSIPPSTSSSHSRSAAGGSVSCGPAGVPCSPAPIRSPTPIVKAGMRSRPVPLKWFEPTITARSGAWCSRRSRAPCRASRKRRARSRWATSWKRVFMRVVCDAPTPSTARLTGRHRSSRRRSG